MVSVVNTHSIHAYDGIAIIASRKMKIGVSKPFFPFQFCSFHSKEIPSLTSTHVYLFFVQHCFVSHFLLFLLLLSLDFNSLFFISYFILLRLQSSFVHTQNRNEMISLSSVCFANGGVVSFQTGLACMQHIHEQHNSIIKIHGSIVNKGF